MYKIEAVHPTTQQDPAGSLIRSAELPKDPTLRALCDEVIDRLKYAFVASALHPERVASEDVLFRRFLDSRTPRAREGYRVKADALFRSTEADRRASLGRYATVSLDAFAGHGSSGLPKLANPAVQVDAKAVSGALRSLEDELTVRPHEAEHALHQTIGRIDPHVISALARHPAGTTPPPPNPGGGPALKLKLDPDVIRGAGYHKLGLFLTGLRCVVENESSPDEIGMGGIIIRPDGGTSLRNPFMISRNMGTDEDEDDLVTFGGEGKLLAEWDLVIPGPHRYPETWPTFYGALIALTEKDGGGFDEFLKLLWEKVSSAVTDWIATEVGAVIGGAIGNWIGAIVGAIVGAFIGWLITEIGDDDDLIGVALANIYLGAMTESYYQWAKLIGPPHRFKLKFTSSEGSYRGSFHFKVY